MRKLLLIMVVFLAGCNAEDPTQYEKPIVTPVSLEDYMNATQIDNLSIGETK